MIAFDDAAVLLNHADFDVIATKLATREPTVKTGTKTLLLKDVIPLPGDDSLLFPVMHTYYHSGNLGDIIYAMYAIREHGGGNLIVGQEQNKTSPCSNPITEEQFNKLQPLLKKQPYIQSSTWNKTWPKSDFIDLNVFRDHWNDPQLRLNYDINSLCQMHFFTLGIIEKFSSNPWLEVPDPIVTKRIVIHRSQRYRNSKFPWSVITSKYRDSLLFTGFPEEHKDFCSSFGMVEFYPVSDFLTMARLIKGASVFVGNQSFPCSMALGMGQRTYQESWQNGHTPDSWRQSQDCLFDRPDFCHGITDLSKFESWIC